MTLGDPSITDSGVPVIDIADSRSGIDAAKRRIAEQIDDACRAVGFLVIAGHGVSLDLIARMHDVSRRFFDLPEVAKRRYIRSDPDTYRGYYPLASNAVAYSRDDRAAPPDFREMFAINPISIDPGDPYYATPLGQQLFAPNIWPEVVPGFVRTWTDYYLAMEGLAVSLMRLFALALGLAEDWFDDKIDKHVTNLVASNYPDQPEELPGGQLRAGAHTDYGSLTILKTEDKPGGLEVLGRDGAWRAVPVIPDTFIINIGDLMARWTNERWVSTMHRVANPPRDASIGTRRQSLIFFHQPNYDAAIECLPTCLGAEGDKFPPITSGGHLLSKIRKTHDVYPGAGSLRRTDRT
jgi:isopenicillin N synthase-like dioxygenase